MGDLKEKADHFLAPVLGHYHQLEVDHGQGVYVVDTSGQNYLDFTSGIAVTSTGHCHPQVVKAIQKQAEKLIHICQGIAYYSPHIDLVELLVQLSPFKEASVVIGQSGSEAVEASLKLAKYVSKKQTIVAFTHSFHGRTLAALSATYKAKYKAGYEGWLIDDVVFCEYPYYYQYGQNMSRQEYTFDCLRRFKETVMPIKDNVAAVIIEPVLGEGGYVPAPVEFIQELRQFTTENKMLLIFDEIQCGIGRTGTMFALEHYDVAPDILTLAKGLASGMPLGACIARKDLMDQWTTSAHGGTFLGNPVCCAAAMATLEVIESEMLLDNAYAVGQMMKSLLEEAQTFIPCLGDIRGVGLMIGLEIIDPKTGKPDPTRVATIRNAALKRGLLLISCGDQDQVIRLAPPLIINREQAKEGLDTLIDILKDVG